MKKALFFLCFVILCYVSVLIFFLIKEDSFVYHPDYTSRKVGIPPDSLHLNYVPVSITTADKIKLKGWIILSHSFEKADWIIFLHGNAGNVSDMGYPQRYAQLTKLGYNVLSLDYRGYGASEGSPSEQGLYKDGFAAYIYLTRNLSVPSDKIIIYGYSLGTGVATQLASLVPSKALIFEGAYTSLPDIGRQQYPFLPISYMAKNIFNSLERINRIKIPKLFIHASDDTQIPIEMNLELYNTADPPKKFLKIKGGHIDAAILDSAKLYEGIAEFLNGLH
jgi:uncharacterized protein